ncbi:ubiquitin-conjugating enzyme E2 J2-like [Eupeodes corollae]|uniref:ubiquitin-conjugating enzyme E2 J2-like n=1 Tax=Eupeodes corollae TaxID=290404 RepID=UPI002490C3A5|nr:ubiquitin-conjugating enzyme E2 J2-like [Eupeodes corollae]
MTGRKSSAILRMKRDYLNLKKDPVPYITAEPLPSNILEWHYVVKGPEDTPYKGGYYHGTLLFPREFPFKPPSIYMHTPNGRFKTNTRLCLSISDYHPDTWNPTWSVGTILTGLLSFMLENTFTMGSVESLLYEKKQYAKKSLVFNLKNPIFRELFPHICDEINCHLKKQQELLEASSAGSRLTVCPNSAGEISGVNININFGNSRGIGSGTDGQGAITDIEFNENSKKFNINQIHRNNKNSCCNWYSIYLYIIAIISFAMFALIVNYMITNLN